MNRWNDKQLDKLNEVWQRINEGLFGGKQRKDQKAISNIRQKMSQVDVVKKGEEWLGIGGRNAESTIDGVYDDIVQDTFNGMGDFGENFEESVREKLGKAANRPGVGKAIDQALYVLDWVTGQGDIGDEGSPTTVLDDESLRRAIAGIWAVATGNRAFEEGAY